MMSTTVLETCRDIQWTYYKTRICALSWLITKIILKCTVSKTPSLVIKQRNICVTKFTFPGPRTNCCDIHNMFHFRPRAVTGIETVAYQRCRGSHFVVPIRPRSTKIRPKAATGNSSILCSLITEATVRGQTSWNLQNLNEIIGIRFLSRYKPRTSVITKARVFTRRPWKESDTFTLRSAASILYNLALCDHINGLTSINHSVHSRSLRLYPCNENQLDALFIHSSFRQSTSTCFGHVCSPSSGEVYCVYTYINNNWYVLCFSVDCLLAGQPTVNSILFFKWSQLGAN